MIKNPRTLSEFQRTGTSHHLSFVSEQTILTFRINNICNRRQCQQAAHQDFFVLPESEKQDAFIYVCRSTLASTRRAGFYEADVHIVRPQLKVKQSALELLCFGLTL